MSDQISIIKEEKEGASQDAVAVVNTSGFASVSSDAEYNNMIWGLCDKVISAELQILDIQWGIGDGIKSYIDTLDSTNVSAALRKISEDVGAACHGRLSELSEGSLRKALKIREKFTATQLELAKAGCVSLRNLLPMCKNDVTDEERGEILKEVSEGKISQKDIPDRVKELHPQKEGQRGGTRKKAEEPLVFMKRLQGDIDKLLADMKEDYRLHTVAALGSEDQAAKEEYTQYYKANAERIEQLNKQWAANAKVTQVFLEE